MEYGAIDVRGGDRGHARRVGEAVASASDCQAQGRAHRRTRSTGRSPIRSDSVMPLYGAAAARSARGTAGLWIRNGGRYARNDTRHARNGGGGGREGGRFGREGRPVLGEGRR